MSDDQQSGTKLIAFRVPLKDYEHFERAARKLAEEEKIKSDNVNAFCRACCYVQVNQFIQLELMAEQAALNEEKKQEAAQAYS